MFDSRTNYLRGRILQTRAQGIVWRTGHSQYDRGSQDPLARYCGENAGQQSTQV